MNEYEYDIDLVGDADDDTEVCLFTVFDHNENPTRILSRYDPDFVLEFFRGLNMAFAGATGAAVGHCPDGEILRDMYRTFSAMDTAMGHEGSEQVRDALQLIVEFVVRWQELTLNFAVTAQAEEILRGATPPPPDQ